MSEIHNNSNLYPETRKHCALYVKNGNKYYGTKKSPSVILHNVNMMVPKGAIYGLLGASGCGKTTLLNCMLGIKKLNSGEIYVMEHQRIGYMPQQNALYAELSIYETFEYFGGIYNMRSELIDERIKFLSNLLMLRDLKRRICELSGGEKRRVSFVVALLHEPELFVLDEPTVGLDPLLRESIWNYLLKVVDEKRATILLTTHYIDETRQAQMIGFLREGRIIVEGPPESLLNRFNAETLDEVFLKLSIIQDKVKETNTPLEVVNGDDSHTSRVLFNNEKLEVFLHHKPAQKFTALKKHHVKILVWKNLIWISRNPLLILNSILLTIIQIYLFYLTNGQDLLNLKVAVVNYETHNRICDTLTCNSTQLSCYYLQHLEKKSLNLIYYDSEDEALESVIHAKNYALVIFKKNYSMALKSRITNLRRTTDWDFSYSSIDVFLDSSAYTVSRFIKKYVYSSFNGFIEDYLLACNETKTALSLPIRLNMSIYGERVPNLVDYALPGAILVFTYFLTSILSASALFKESRDGVSERLQVIGVGYLEVILSHLISEFCVTLCHVMGVFIFIFWIIDVIIRGSHFLVMMLILLNAVAGMCYGFALFFSHVPEKEVMYIILGTLLTGSTLSGSIWPADTMPYVIYVIGSLTPFLIPTEALRSVMLKGWGFYEPIVYEGFICLSIWIIILLLFSVMQKLNK